MKPRKRARSPNLDCEECLPISKRITRLNIQASKRHSIEEASPTELQNQRFGPINPQLNGAAINAQLPWQQQHQQSCSAHHHPHPPHGHAHSPQEGNNNFCMPCSSRQCHSDQTMVNKTSLQAYAAQHSLPKEDLSGYKPDLDEVENPHYYRINSLLYEAHLEKAVRKGSNNMKQ